MRRTPPAHVQDARAGRDIGPDEGQDQEVLVAFEVAEFRVHGLSEERLVQAGEKLPVDFSGHGEVGEIVRSGRLGLCRRPTGHRPGHRLAPGEQLAVERGVVRGLAGKCVAPEGQGRVQVAQLLPPLQAPEDAGHEARGVALAGQEPVHLVLDHVRHAADGKAHRGTAAGRGLHHGVGQVVLHRGQHVDVGHGVDPGHDRRVLDVAEAHGAQARELDQLPVRSAEEGKYQAFPPRILGHQGQQTADVACALALGLGLGAEEHHPIGLGEPEAGPDRGPRQGTEGVQRQAVGDDRDRPRAEQAAAADLAGQPAAGGHGLDGQPLVGPAFDLPLPGGHVRLAPAAELRAGPAGGFEAAAVAGIVATAGEGILVVQGPDQGLVADDGFEPGDGQEARHPVQVDHVGRRDERMVLKQGLGLDVAEDLQARGPLGEPGRKLLPAFPDGLEGQCGVQSLGQRRLPDAGIGGALLQHEHGRIEPSGRKALVQPEGRVAGAAVVQGGQVDDLHGRPQPNLAARVALPGACLMAF